MGNERKIVSADPTALGVFGLAMVTFVASTQKLGWTTGVGNLIPWAIFLGAAAQLIASMKDFQRNNYFGSIVLGAYGLFWFAVAMTWMASTGVFGEGMKVAADAKQLGVAFIGYLIFSLFITIAAMETNKVFLIILALIDVLFISLSLSVLGFQHTLMGTIAGVSEFAISIFGFYGAGAIFLNTFYQRQILPLGKPLGLIKKGPLAVVASNSGKNSA